MTEICVSIPNELEDDIKRLSKLGLSLVIAKMIKPELDRLAELKRIVRRSQLTEEDVRELSEKTDKVLSKRFLHSLK